MSVPRYSEYHASHGGGTRYGAAGQRLRTVRRTVSCCQRQSSRQARCRAGRRKPQTVRYFNDESFRKCHHGACCHRRLYECAAASAVDRLRAWIGDQTGAVRRDQPQDPISVERETERQVSGRILLCSRRRSGYHGGTAGLPALRCHDCHRQNGRRKFGCACDQRLLQGARSLLRRQRCRKITGLVYCRAPAERRGLHRDLQGEYRIGRLCDEAFCSAGRDEGSGALCQTV